MKLRIATISGKRILIMKDILDITVKIDNVSMSFYPLRKIIGWGWEFFFSIILKRGLQAESTSLCARTMSPSHTCNKYVLSIVNIFQMCKYFALLCLLQTQDEEMYDYLFASSGHL